MTLRILPLLAILILASAPLPARAADSGPLCDQLAGEPEDADLPGVLGTKGVPWYDIDVAMAEPPCRQAIADHPDERRHLVELGRVLWKKGDFTEARSLYQRAMDKGSVIAIVALGLFYQDGDGVSQDNIKASEYFRQAIDKNSLAAMSDLAWLYRNDGVPGKGIADAIPLYERAVMAGDWPSMVDLGHLYEQGLGETKDLRHAEQLFRQAMAGTDPSVSAEAKNALAWMFTENHGDLAEAERLVNQALAEVRASDDGARASYLDTRAWIEHRTGGDILAVADAEESVRLGPDVPAVYDRLGDIYAALGRPVEARTSWEMALKLPPPTVYDEPNFDPAAIRKKIGDAAPR